MAGAYCKFCDQRCFVYRVAPDGPQAGWAGHMATCRKGMEHDLKMTGHTHLTAINPAQHKRALTKEHEMIETPYTEHRYTKPQEHTLYPQPQARFECAECGTSGYWYPDQGEVGVYRACIWTERVTPGNQHVWVVPGTAQTQGTGERAFASDVPEADALAAYNAIRSGKRP